MNMLDVPGMLYACVSGPITVKARQYERTDPDVLEYYGGGEIWPPAAAWDLGEIAANGNYLENDAIAVSHGVCGDTPQVNPHKLGPHTNR